MYSGKQIIEGIITTILGIGIFAGMALAFEINYGFLLITIISIILLILFQRKQKKDKAKVKKEKIKEQWGKDHIDKRDFIHIEKLYLFLLDKEAEDFAIDDITWRDLNMDSVFSKIDHTMSLPGMQYLYNILRLPIFRGDVLNKRNRIVNSLLENKEIAESIQYPLSLLGKKDGKDIFTYFKNGLVMSSKPLIIFIILSYLPFAALGLLFFDKLKAYTILLIVVMLNTAVYQLNKKKIYEEMDTFLYLGGLIKTAENILKLDTDIIDLDQEEIKELLKRLRAVRKNIMKINYNENLNSEAQILLHYYNMILLKEPKAFFKTVGLINKYKLDFLELYKLVGKMDAYISIASYKDGLQYYSEPKFEEDGSKFYLKAEEIYHPLLEDPVSYSFELNNKGSLVTGSNASGKSTYLRTIGINAIFAQTMNLVLAKDFHSSYFKLLTSIGTTDSIVKGDSYFMAEAKSLKRILETLDPNQPVLCILDEIFRGTNTAERISAAREALNYMIVRNCCVIAATHDLELTTLVNENFDNYHFRETIEENDIKFDYILRKGASTTRNAIAILQYLGYPRELYENAAKGAMEYLSNENQYG